MVVFMENEDIVDEFAKGLYEIGEQHSKDLKTLLDYILSDMFNSYDKLIAQRNECIDKYIKIISFMLQDETNIGKPIQALMEKKHNDVDLWQKEIAPIHELNELLFADDDPTDEKFQEVVEKIKNI